MEFKDSQKSILGLIIEKINKYRLYSPKQASYTYVWHKDKYVIQFFCSEIGISFYHFPPCFTYYISLPAIIQNEMPDGSSLYFLSCDFFFLKFFRLNFVPLKWGLKSPLISRQMTTNVFNVTLL